MEPWQVAGTIVVAATALITAVAAFRKSGPESTKIIVESANVSVETASSLRDEIRGDLTALKAEFAQYRADTQQRLDELGAEVRAEKAEKLAVKAENDRLRQRVSDLEAEVAQLKANGYTTEERPHAAD